MSKLVYFLVPLGILLCGITLVNLQESNSVHDLKYMSDHLTVINTDLPPGLNFCGEAVPLDKLEVKRRLQKELDKHLKYQASTRLLIKRINRFQATILPILEAQGIPEDFFYLAIAESALSNVTSSKGAKGFWQFMPAAAKYYGLEISETVDERLNLEKATLAACKYLKDSYKRYGDWSLVAASYNMGPTGLNRAIKTQGTNDFYQLRLNRETGHYLYRILGLKCVLDNPTRYGIKVSDLYSVKNYAFRYKKIREDIANLSVYAQEQGTTVEELKSLNPWLISNKLRVADGKTYKLKVPATHMNQPLVAAVSK